MYTYICISFEETYVKRQGKDGDIAKENEVNR
jgi:hypothetical protein